MKNYVLTDKLSKDIDDLEKRIKYVGLENFKKISIRNIKICGRFIQMIAPYLLAAIIPFIGQSFLFDIPFYRENVKQEKCYMMEVDNRGIESYQSQYEKFSDEKDRVYIYGNWKEENGVYTRTIKSYRINLDELSEIKELVHKKDIEIEKLLGNPVSNITETKNIITDEEKEESGYIKVVYYYKDKDDFIIVTQPLGECIAFSLLYLFELVLCEACVFKIRDEFSSFYFPTYYAKYIEKYKKTNTKILEKKLEIKKDSYKRLTGDNYGR